MNRDGICESVLDLIGKTPMVRLRRLPGPNSAQVVGKLENLNPAGSVKDRICLSMVEQAERDGLLQPGATIVESTSGNTGIGLAMVAAVKGYRLVIVMPEAMSIERQYMLRCYGVEIVLTPAEEGMAGARRKAEEIAGQAKAFMPEQFTNQANVRMHRETTGQEILQATGGRLDAFVAGVGTAGTLIGVAEVLHTLDPRPQIVAVEPASSPVLSGGHAGPHRIMGIGANFMPPIYRPELVDRVVKVGEMDAFQTTQRLARQEGLFLGISAGAAVHAALQVAAELGKGKQVVVILPDTGERYASMEPYFRF